MWLFLHEFPSCRRSSSFRPSWSLAAPKGVAVVIGAQDTAQIRAVYGQDQAKSWFGMTSTKIITVSMPAKRPKTLAG